MLLFSALTFTLKNQKTNYNESLACFGVCSKCLIMSDQTWLMGKTLSAKLICEHLNQITLL